MRTYFLRMQAIFLAVTLVLPALVFSTSLSADAKADGVIFKDDFEDKTDWESLAFSEQKWESVNGGPVKAVKNEETGNTYVSIYAGVLSSLNKRFDKALEGLIDLKFDIALGDRSCDGLYIFPESSQTAPSLRIVEFDYYNTPGTVKFKDENGNFSSASLEPNAWVNFEMSFDIENNKFSMWMTKNGEDRTPVFENHYCKLNNSFYGFSFFYPERGSGMGELKLDNFLISQIVLNTGIDENFDSYQSVDELPGDWINDDVQNISVSNGKLNFYGAGKVTNIHKPYSTDSLSLSGDIQYISETPTDDLFTLSILSSENVCQILSISGTGNINDETIKMPTPGSTIHFEATVNASDYIISINNTIVSRGELSSDFSLGVTGITLQNMGNSWWSVDNLKSYPSLTEEQMNEIREDLNAVIISEPEPKNTILLPRKGINGCDITWICSLPSVIDTQSGLVKSPDWEMGPVDVVLTCCVSKYGITLSKEFSYHMEPAINNLFENGDFENLDENGNVTGWFSTSAHPIQSSEEAQHGKRGALISGREASIHSGAQNISLKPNRSYHFSGYVKLAEEAIDGQDGRISVWLQGGPVNSAAGDGTNYVTSYDAFYMNTKNWININSDFDTNVTPQVWPTSAYIYPFPVGSTTLSFYMDNFEIYEYVLSKLSIKGDDSVIAPNSGETEILYQPMAINQYGTDVGLKNIEYEWSVDEAGDGVSINNSGKLSVSEYAENQQIRLVCKAKKGTVCGSSWVFGEKLVSIVNNADDKPKAHNLSISGDVTNGEVLKADYEYFQKNGIEEGNSSVQWFMADSYDGQYQEIQGKTSRELYIDQSLSEKFIKFSVVPKTVNDLQGDVMYSNVITKHRVPFITAASIKGNAVVGKTIKGSYSFDDYNGDEEGESKYFWMLGDTKDDEAYEVIEGANGQELTVTKEMENKFIKFKVVPVSQMSPQIGDAFLTDAIIGPTKPQINNVKIIGSPGVGNVLSVEYLYYDPNNDAENSSIIKWYSGTKLLSTSPTFTPTEAGMEIYSEITPVSQEYPEQGLPVKSSTVKTFSKSSNSGGSGSGGGVFASSNTIKTPSKPVIEHIDEAVPTVSFSDMKGHWAEHDVAALADLNIIKGKTQNCFAPEESITRAEFLTFIIRCLNVENKTYSMDFADVASDDWYANTVQSAYDCKIISKADKFYPNDAITREEISKMVGETYMFMMNDQWPSTYDLSAFTDSNSISDWAVGYMGGCVELGVIKGNDSGMLNSHANATRAQAAAMINRLINLIY